MTDGDQGASEEYQAILADYLATHSEQALYRVSILSERLVESGLGPEDIVALHFEALERTVSDRPIREQARCMADAHQFLLEVMIAYGVQYKEYLELRLEEALRQSAAREELERQRALDAERVGRQKGEILTVIAHELRTPLTAVQGNLDLARRSLTRGQVEQVPQLLERAREAIDRLSRLSADLVQASRGELPQLDMTELDLGLVLTQSCTWVEAAAGAKDIELMQHPAHEETRVLGNSDGLLSLFGNLLSNAVRYTPDGGKVSVRHGVADGWAWVEIQDTGIGMSEAVQARIFDKFYRAPEAYHVEAKGLGLGLSLVQQMIEAHSGRLEVKSLEGHGSTFRVLLPLMAVRAEEESRV